MINPSTEQRSYDRRHANLRTDMQNSRDIGKTGKGKDKSYISPSMLPMLELALLSQPWNIAYFHSPYDGRIRLEGAYIIGVQLRRC